jgi:uroporphyrinogen-III synthase
MNKRANLAAALQTATRGGEATSPQAPATVTAIRAKTPSRIGKKTVAAHFDPAVSRQLKQLGLDRDTSTQALLREALNDLFTKYGKPPIA